MNFSVLPVSTQVLATLAMILSFVAGWQTVKYFWCSWYLLVILEEGETYKPLDGISYEVRLPLANSGRMTMVFEGPMSKTEAEVRQLCYQSKILHEISLLSRATKTALCSRETKTTICSQKDSQ